MPIYIYRNPNTNEKFEVLRKVSERNDPYFSPDGVECVRDIIAENDSSTTTFGVVDKSKEFWERFPSDVAKSAPKYVRAKDGTRILYDPTKHR